MHEAYNPACSVSVMPYALCLCHAVCIFFLFDMNKSIVQYAFIIQCVLPLTFSVNKSVIYYAVCLSCSMLFSITQHVFCLSFSINKSLVQYALCPPFCVVKFIFNFHCVWQSR